MSNPPPPLKLGQPTLTVVPTETTVPAVRRIASSPALAAPYEGSALTLEAVNKVGQRSQQGIADLSSRLASTVKTSNMDELGDLLGQTLVAAKGFDPANTKSKWWGLVKRKVEEIRLGYESAESTTNRLVGEIDKRMALHRQRDSDIRQMIAANRAYHEQLGPEIEQLLSRVEWMEANAPAVDPAQPMSAQRAQEWQTVCAMGRKHADDLRRAQVVSQQMDAQMQMLQQQGLMLVQKFDSFKTTTLPVLRQAFVMYIMALEQSRSAAMAESVDNLTDNTLKANAAKLGQTTAAVHGSLARSSVSLEAIQAGHTAMLQSLDEIERIRADMKTRLAAEAPQIEAASRELAERLARRA